MRHVLRNALVVVAVCGAPRAARAQSLAALPAGAEVRLTTEPTAGPVVQTGRLLAVTRDTVFLAASGEAALRVARPAIRAADVRVPNYVARVLVGLAIGATSAVVAQPSKPSPVVMATVMVPTAIVGAFTLPFMRWRAIVP